MTATQLASGVSQGDTWWWQALASRPSFVCAAVILVSGLALAVGLGVLWRLGSAVRRERAARQRSGGRAGVAGDEGGSAMMEFALILPVMLFFALVMAQATVVLGANFHVHYAAFAAARCAIVQVPTDYSGVGGEAANVIMNSTSGYKHELVRRAAVFALVPVSGRAAGNGAVNADAYVQALTALYTSYNQAAPNWVANVIADRVRYADANTAVTLMDVSAANGTVTLTPMGDDTTHTYGPVDPVAVQVTHKLNLSLPMGIARLFEGPNGGQEGNWVYCTLTAHSMLTNQGVPTALPPAPSLPRSP